VIEDVHGLHKTGKLEALVGLGTFEGFGLFLPVIQNTLEVPQSRGPGRVAGSAVLFPVEIMDIRIPFPELKPFFNHV
jgi:hypothetical protein